MFKYAILSFSYIIIAVILFSIPLILKYHVFVPQRDYIVRGDTFFLNHRYPTLWCESLELSAGVTFNAYQFDVEPRVNKSTVHRSLSTRGIKLANKDQEYWRFHFLEGTNVTIYACAKLLGASVTLIRSKRYLFQCLEEYHSSYTAVVESLEELSESESDEDTSSISSSQGVISNETEDPFVCSRSLEYQRLQSQYRCHASSRAIRRKFLFTHHIAKTGFYYVLFGSDSVLDSIPNQFSVKLILDRTNYEHDSTDSCSNVTTCELPLTLGSRAKTVIEMSTVNGTLEEESVEYSCNPRKGVFFIFYLGFVLMVFLCAFQ